MMMGKIVIFSYLAAWGAIDQLLGFLQLNDSEVLQRTTGVIALVSHVDFAAPITALFGQIIYSVIERFRYESSIADDDSGVQPWSNRQNKLMYMRIILSVLISTAFSVFVSMVGGSQNFINAPEWMGEAFGFLCNIGLGYFIVRITKQDFEDKVWDKKIEDKFFK